jgi:hypothetical protein
MSNRFRHILHWLPLAVGVFLLQGAFNPAYAQDVDYKSYTLFVYNFIKYIEWPEAKSQGDFVVGVLGDSPVLAELEKLAATKKAKGRTIIIKRFASLEKVTDCHLLYVTSSKSSSIKALKEMAKNKPMLIVGEREGLARKGAALSFVTIDDDVLKFDINKAEIEQHNLKIPGTLLLLGLII